jgi:glycosyltransferase involved in cell wall biosynthesis
MLNMSITQNISGYSALQALKPQQEIIEPWPEYFEVDYFDGFDLPAIAEDVSVIIPTYNRCPFPPGDERYRANPLYCSAISILRQRGGIDKQLVIIDDASDDNTASVVKDIRSLSRESGTDVIYVRNKQRSGAPLSRKTGLEIAEGKLSFLTDDDCIASPYAIFGGALVRRKLEMEGPLLLPLYLKRTKPSRTLPASEIGKIDLEKGEITSNFEAFPLEYIGRCPFLDPDLRVLQPFEIFNLCCNYLIETDVLRAAGIPDDFKRMNGYGEETEIGMRLMEAGVQSYFVPDPKLQVIHLKFGDIRRPFFIERDWMAETLEIPTGILFNESVKERYGTGCRVSPEEHSYSKVRSFFQILSKRSPEAGLGWAANTYRDFVVLNKMEFTKWGRLIESYDDRKKIWERAIYDACYAEPNAFGFEYIKRTVLQREHVFEVV